MNGPYAWRYRRPKEKDPYCADSKKVLDDIDENVSLPQPQAGQV